MSTNGFIFVQYGTLYEVCNNWQEAMKIISPETKGVYVRYIYFPMTITKIEIPKGY